MSQFLNFIWIAIFPESIVAQSALHKKRVQDDNFKKIQIRVQNPTNPPNTRLTHACIESILYLWTRPS